jgi:hypothetical protein
MGLGSRRHGREPVTARGSEIGSRAIIEMVWAGAESRAALRPDELLAAQLLRPKP